MQKPRAVPARGFFVPVSVKPGGDGISDQVYVPAISSRIFANASGAESCGAWSVSRVYRLAQGLSVYMRYCSALKTDWSRRVSI